MISLGVDIGGTSVKAALLRDNLVLATSRSDSYSKPATDQIIAAIRQATAGMEVPNSICVCCPGLLDRATRSIKIAVNLPGLVGVSLDELLARALEPIASANVGGAHPMNNGNVGGAHPASDAPCRVGSAHVSLFAGSAQLLTDAAATAYDLFISRSLTGRFLCLTIGTGVGACVIEDGRFLHISGETPGHFGQLDVSLDDTPPIGPDGGAGSLEAYIGAAALAARYGKNAAEKLDANDPPIRALVRAIRISHAIYRPAHIALAGGIGIRLGRLLNEIKAAVDRNLTHIVRADWTLFAGESDFHAACGAARYALRAMNDSE